MGKTLYEKIFDQHVVSELSENQYQLFIDLHLIHEVTSPQAFAMLAEENLPVMFPDRTFATIDHIIPTNQQSRPFLDILGENMAARLEQNVKAWGIRYFSADRGEQGIVHVIGPEQGLTQPGMTICCGDSHTATHGAFGAIAFGIGTSQVRDVLATQTVATPKLKVRKISVDGSLAAGVYAKDVILTIINQLGAKAGGGFAYEYSGSTFEKFSMAERMTVCNMSIEGSARCGYVNPDQVTFNYLKGRPFVTAAGDFEELCARWTAVRSDPDAVYDDQVGLNAEEIKPMITWGVGLDQSIAIGEHLPADHTSTHLDQTGFAQAMAYMKFIPGEKITGERIDVAFIGSCTNARFEDLDLVAQLLERSGSKVASHVKALLVPGSQRVREQLINSGAARIYEQAGFEFRTPGCSMCLGMNPDQLSGSQLCASSSNRNYKGRMGSPSGRTLLMSPAMVAACAVSGEVADLRQVFRGLL